MMAITHRFKQLLSFALLLLAVAWVSPVYANDYGRHIVFANEGYPKVRALNTVNERFLIGQRQSIDSLVRENFGRTLAQPGKGNMGLLQRIVDNKTIDRGDKKELQALGVVLGDIFVSKHKILSWYVYEDELGKTHAVCIKDSTHCLFPITMLSRRMEVGLKPSVERIFNKGMDEISEFLPKVPYSGKK
ncbi:MAG: hypothetical protein COA42_00880 [Alteromonadaceae bacterium]|nr:MAG: hypothetical protein COA42_00880 [Alteromonadaceae bacterium]